jgi:hypothetical protein
LKIFHVKILGTLRNGTRIKGRVEVIISVIDKSAIAYRADIKENCFLLET